MALTTGPTPPPNPSPQDIWWFTIGELFFVWDGTYWKSATTYQFQFSGNLSEYFCTLKQFPIDYNIYLMDLTGSFCIYDGLTAELKVYRVKEDTEEVLVWSRSIEEGGSFEYDKYYNFSQEFNTVFTPGPNSSIFHVVIDGSVILPMSLNYKLVHSGT